ncbi:hypothetical protein T265_12847, partial [Opisthorchis viverrini]
RYNYQRFPSPLQILNTVGLWPTNADGLVTGQELIEPVLFFSWGMKTTTVTEDVKQLYELQFGIQYEIRIHYTPPE